MAMGLEMDESFMDLLILLTRMLNGEMTRIDSGLFVP